MKRIQLIAVTALMTLFAFGGLALVGVGEAPVVQAQSSQKQLCEGSGGRWTGSSCINDNSVGVETIVERILNILFYVVGIASVIMLIIGGIRYVVSGGDQNAVAGAKNTILYAIVGIVIAFAAFAISNFVINRLSGSEDTAKSTQHVELRQV